jgi:hypothetical protein
LKYIQTLKLQVEIYSDIKKSNIGCPPMLSHDDCSVDKDCPGRKKCCTFGCSKKCINPRYSWSIWLYSVFPVNEYDKQVTIINKQINNDYNRNKLRV